MTPDNHDLELIRQVGKLEGGQRAIERSITEMATANSREHGEVLRALEGIRGELKGKADVSRVDNHAARLRELEGKDHRDAGEVDGSAKTLKFLQGAGALALMFLTYLVTKGGA